MWSVRRQGGPHQIFVPLVWAQCASNLHVLPQILSPPRSLSYPLSLAHLPSSIANAPSHHSRGPLSSSLPLISLSLSLSSSSSSSSLFRIRLSFFLLEDQTASRSTELAHSNEHSYPSLLATSVDEYVLSFLPSSLSSSRGD